MRCDKYKKSNDDIRQSIEIQEHLKHCEDCRKEFELDQSLTKLFENVNEGVNENPIPIEMMRQRVEQPAKSRKTVLSGMKGISSLAATAALLLLVFAFLGDESGKTAYSSYEVALNNVDFDLVSENDKVCDMLYAIGLDEAAVDVTGCDSTCSLVIFDLKNEHEVNKVVNLFTGASEHEITTTVRPMSGGAI